MEYSAFLTAAERGAVPPLALLHGVDGQLLDDALAHVTRALFADASEVPLGREVLEGAETTAEAVVRSALTLPFMTPRRLVAVRRCQELPPRGAEVLAEYARDPNPTSCLLLLADEVLSAHRERRTDHWLLAAVPAAAVVPLPARRGADLQHWLRQRAALEGITLGEDAARLLVEWVGEDGARLLSETRKAALVSGGGARRVSVNEVQAIVGEHRMSEVFDLTRAVERRDTAQALRTLDRLLATEEPIMLLALLTRELRSALTIGDLRARGQSTEQIARALRRPPAVVEAVAAHATAEGLGGLSRKLARCWEVDYRLKSGGEPRAEMTALVAELCAGR